VRLGSRSVLWVTVAHQLPVASVVSSGPRELHSLRLPVAGPIKYKGKARRPPSCQINKDLVSLASTVVVTVTRSVALFLSWCRTSPCAQPAPILSSSSSDAVPVLSLRLLLVAVHWQASVVTTAKIRVARRGPSKGGLCRPVVGHLGPSPPTEKPSMYEGHGFVVVAQREKIYRPRRRGDPGPGPEKT
jgi:hypothetical protein